MPEDSDRDEVPSVADLVYQGDRVEEPTVEDRRRADELQRGAELYAGARQIDPWPGDDYPGTSLNEHAVGRLFARAPLTIVRMTRRGKLMRRRKRVDSIGRLHITINLRAPLRVVCWARRFLPVRYVYRRWGTNEPWQRGHRWRHVFAGTWADASHDYCQTCGLIPK